MRKKPRYRPEGPTDPASFVRRFNPGGRQVPPREVVAYVERELSLAKGEIKSPRRTAYLTRARRLASVLMIILTKKSMADMGRMLDRDHTTILHHLRATRDAIQNNDRKEVYQIQRMVDEVVAEWDAKLQRGPRFAELPPLASVCPAPSSTSGPDLTATPPPAPEPTPVPPRRDDGCDDMRAECFKASLKLGPRLLDELRASRREREREKEQANI
jgi:hypothetical protein